MRPGVGVAAAHAVVRDRVPHLGADRPPSPDIEAVRGLVAAGTLLTAADSARDVGR
jgi:histidine ammonia-lyase